MDGDTAAAPPPAEPSQLEKRRALCQCIRADVHAADLRWSLFAAAAQSYKYDSVLRPFPPLFLRGSPPSKRIHELREVMTQMPAFPTLLSLLETPSSDCSNRGQLVDLLYWVLIVQDDPGFRTLSKEEMDEVLQKAPGKKFARPHFIFAVNHKKTSDKHKRFLELSKSRKTFWGYHGSRLDNFYSILCHGLLSTFSKREIFGTGTYLSSDFTTSVLYSQVGCGWGGSLIGSGLSCTAFCEIVEHPDVVCEKPDSGTSKTADDSQCGPVPKEYIIVRNSDLVQIQYLLIHGQNPHPLARRKVNDQSMMSWFGKHKLFTLMLGYVLLLSAVGISNSPTVMRYYRLLLRRWNH
ncbi:hypothetical protein ONE63_003238 [Megalurothrips usitatus]|uniref:Poly [ADP-ribose] polymerase n=1 Tax=Megalurothrips usitatus TaxID=439358 RepID=A0AAV7XD96_9NEOP|nr:hypothetical protein ONE63_003238 [Megalurothrips usitatus]